VSSSPLRVLNPDIAEDVDEGASLIDRHLGAIDEAGGEDADRAFVRVVFAAEDRASLGREEAQDGR
jgi:hypothetical protein